MPELPKIPPRGKNAVDASLGSCLLRTETTDDLAKLLAEVTAFIDPQDFIIQEYVNQIVFYTWDMRRGRRIKSGIFNNALTSALANILRQIMFPPSIHSDLKFWLNSEQLAYQWRFDPELQVRVAGMLEEAGYDYSAIEAKAYQQVTHDITNVDRMIDAASQGRDKTLRSISKYRKTVADQLRRKTDLILAQVEDPNAALERSN